MLHRPMSTLLGLALAVTLASCDNASDRAVEVAVIGESASPFAGGARLPLAAQLVRSATAEGLVGFDERGRVIPALADRWIVTDDGLSYIFRLRDGTWPDKTPLTGDTARAALLQAIAGLRGTALGADLAAIDEVRAMAGRVVEIRLHQAQPDFLQLLAQPELGLLRKGRGAGPMRLTREKDAALLRPIAPEDRGLPQIENWSSLSRKLRLVALPPKRAIERFNAGEIDVVLGGRLADFPRLDASGVSRGAIRLDPVAGLFGLAAVNPQGFLAEPDRREALAMAIDREALANALNVGGWTATTRIVNPGAGDDNGTVGERWPGQSLAERRSVAAARIAKWSADRAAPRLRIALPAGPGSDVLFARLADDFKAIGVEAVQVRENAQADLRLVDTVARYVRTGWFLNQLSCASNRVLCSPSADRLAGLALLEPDPAKRADLFAQAEAQLTIANTFIPFGVPVRWSLVSGQTTGFMPNPWNVHPLMPLAMLPK
ncbi:ABC transporter substrate-binding protein [Novosphingobium sp.]|jgi:ABC-type transport system substrate-binding protein|uniref:ABC transporter substrate-binding protein n=1 Tax=Novosphingobium sp. TaxID=1874826 RepID=UPI0039197FDD